MTRVTNLALALCVVVLSNVGCGGPDNRAVVRPVKRGEPVPGGQLTAAALDEAGLREKWRIPLPGRPTVRGVHVLSQDIVFDVVSRPEGRPRNELIALDRETGRLSWQTGLDGPPVTSPVEDADNVYIFTAGGIVAIEKETGGRIVFRQRQRFVPWGDPTTDLNFVYVMGRDNRIYAVYKREEEGRDHIDWWNYNVDASVVGSPAVRELSLYYVNTEGVVVAIRLSRVTGRHDWDFRTDARIESPLTLVDDTIYVGAADGKLYSLKATGGVTRKDQQNWLLPYNAGSGIVSRPYVVDDLVLMQTAETGFHAVKSDDGTGAWTLPGVYRFASRGPRHVHLVNPAGNLVGVEATPNGEAGPQGVPIVAPRWTLPTADFRYIPPVTDSADIYLVGRQGFVRVLTPRE